MEWNISVQLQLTHVTGAELSYTYCNSMASISLLYQCLALLTNFLVQYHGVTEKWDYRGPLCSIFPLGCPPPPAPSIRWSPSEPILLTRCSPFFENGPTLMVNQLHITAKIGFRSLSAIKQLMLN